MGEKAFLLLALLGDKLYFCIVFHGIRFKVSKRLIVVRQSIFFVPILKVCLACKNEGWVNSFSLSA